MENRIELSDLHLRYPGAKRDALAGVGFSVRPGEIFGLLGPSGAGKSTLQRILTGTLRGYRGGAKVDGQELRRIGRAYYEGIGVDFEFPNFYAKFSGRANLAYFASLYSGAAGFREAAGLLERVGLAADADKPVAAYSKGMKMRLGFVRAVQHRPRLLFLDEPTSGLDPANARILKTMIKEEQADGVTVILTTHNMYDAAELCDRVAFIVDGRIMALDTPLALRAAGADGTARPPARVDYAYRDDGLERRASVAMADLAGDSVFRAALDDGRLLSLHSQERSLEDVFIELTGRSLA
ncbi:MAG: ABC transporter ATP-binding protein [Treponema sp. GWB1_62_6]|nr:MAG: ABC transporter ATP-binding protein [Treponema sp. GWA1_62_8]OHE65299.1 MAG: ABC transporter ATP-binding protein [Treponema sp. GWC1_61_84]OHE69672.1 MAG: ABC transporter ATP-binding protein [Treponema sp. GWB1_62_6]OHE75063.1 MAG: ABC transporter ATP-binding protein [Treponema sp. RIFOXYC1_FULL_61_9]HCM28911.1 ABC transporter ATP-binding protein [Treponema sp.]